MVYDMVVYVYVGVNNNNNNNSNNNNKVVVRRNIKGIINILVVSVSIHSNNTYHR